MERAEFKAIVARFRKIYTRDFIPDQATFDTWYQLLQDLPYVTVEAAAVQWMQTEERLPTPAGLRRIAAEIMTPQEEELSEQEAWAMVSRAICRSSYYAEQEFQRLPRAVQRAVGSPANLREWARADSGDVQTVIQSQFLRSYRGVMERRKKDAATSLDVRQKIGQIRQEAGIEEKEAEKIESKEDDGE